MTEQLGLLWLRPEPPAHEVALTREEVARVAVRLADTEGLAVVTFDRVAAELGELGSLLDVHVKYPTDLTDLMLDYGYGELDLPERPSGDWRSDLEMVARQLWAALTRHPWLAVIAQSRPLFSPNALRQLEFSFAALDGLGLDPRTIAMYAGMVSGLGYGPVLARLHEEEALRQVNWETPPPLVHGPIGDFLDELVASGRYPSVGRFLQAGSPHAHGSESYDVTLECLLDGLALRIGSRGI